MSRNPRFVVRFAAGISGSYACGVGCSSMSVISGSGSRDASGRHRHRRGRESGLLPGRRCGAAEMARMNALVAVELDRMRRHERVADLRLSAGVLLAPTLVVAEALLAGVGV